MLNFHIAFVYTYTFEISPSHVQKGRKHSVQSFLLLPLLESTYPPLLPPRPSTTHQPHPPHCSTSTNKLKWNKSFKPMKYAKCKKSSFPGPEHSRVPEPKTRKLSGRLVCVSLTNLQTRRFDISPSFRCYSLWERRRRCERRRRNG